MARRSYLARLAQPLAPADPAVWSTPRAAAEESRQTLHAPVRAAPRAASTAARDPAIAAEPASPLAGTLPEPVGDTLSEPIADRARPATSLSEGARPIAGPPDGRRHSAPHAPFGTDAAPIDTVAPLSQTAPPSHPGASRIAAPDTQASPPLRATAPRPISKSQRVQPSVDAMATEGGPDPREAPPSPASRATASATGPEPAALPTRPTRTPDTPRLHIGAIEIRVSQPPAPAPPPPVAAATPIAPPVAAPISRGYASRFGLAQG
jgi:hypothetical protein